MPAVRFNRPFPRRSGGREIASRRPIVVEERVPGARIDEEPSGLQSPDRGVEGTQPEAVRDDRYGREGHGAGGNYRIQ
jgi:hypothetical protein